MRVLLFSLTLLLVACSQGDDEVLIVKTGCKPSKISTTGSSIPSISESTTYDYTYERGRLMNRNSMSFEYDGNKINGIYLGTTRSVEFQYDSNDRIVGSKYYLKDIDQDQFELVARYKYDYEGDYIRKSTNLLNNKVKDYFRNTSTFNIDSLISYDSNGEISNKEFYRYDDNPNIYSNVCIADYDSNAWIKKNTPNNVIYYERHVIDEEGFEVIFYSAEIEYNEYDYPSLIAIDFSTGGRLLREVSYEGCE